MITRRSRNSHTHTIYAKLVFSENLNIILFCNGLYILWCETNTTVESRARIACSAFI